MKGQKSDLITVLRQFNPWWRGERQADLPTWHRAAFPEIMQWVSNPPAPRALLLSGARQIGKTTLLQQAIDKLIESGVKPNKILYATFDHPLLKLLGLDGLLELWREIEPDDGGMEYIFLDEIQYSKDWQVWIKHQVDFNKRRRIVVTGSATPLNAEGQESGTGRWHTLRLATLSFYEFLSIRKIQVPTLPGVMLPHLLGWPEAKFAEVAAASRPLGSVNEYF
jgi:uncharacterized protein